MSAPLRYARILNGLSSLISRRSAISRSTRAIAALSKPQAFGLDPVVEERGAAGRERIGDRAPLVRWTIAEEAAAAAGTAHFAGERAGRLRPPDQIVDRARRDAWRQPLAVVPLVRDAAADLVPVAALEREAHGRR